MVVGRGHFVGTSGSGQWCLSAHCRVLDLAVRVLWSHRGILHDVVGGDDDFRGQQKSRRSVRVFTDSKSYLTP